MLTIFNVIWLGCLVGEFPMSLFLDLSIQADQIQLEITLQFLPGECRSGYKLSGS